MFVHLSTALKGMGESAIFCVFLPAPIFIEKAYIFPFGCVSLPAPTGFISHFHIENKALTKISQVAVFENTERNGQKLSSGYV